MDILGVNFSIDAAAALVRDGHVVAATTDERFTRRKHSRDFPNESVRACLALGGVDLAAIDAVAFFWNPGVHLTGFNLHQSGAVRHPLEYLSNVPNHLLAQYPRPWDELEVEHVEQVFTLRGSRRPMRIVYVTHHEAHAASAFFVSPFEEAAILTVDGYGEQTSTFLAAGRGNRMQRLARVEFPHSLGAFYAAITQYLGFSANCDEGKVMGLAAHGEPRLLPQLRELIRLTDDGLFEFDLSHFAWHQQRPRRYARKFLARFGPERRPGDPLEDRHRDLAASAQALVEEALIHVGRHLRRTTGLSRLCLAGGVALNCVANSRLIGEAGFDDAFIQPAAGDNGTSLGAALWVSHQLHGLPRVEVMETDALGPAWDDAAIERELRENRLAYERCDDIATAAAERIVAGDVVGWFQGRMEFGPRALGQRSIVADPRSVASKTALDHRIKRREPFRPYAPAVLKAAQAEYFTGPGDSPFMIKNYTVRPALRERIPAVVHVDGSARVQTVDARTRPLFARLVEEFGRLTGVPLVLNTSFNGPGETIVATPRDALRCYHGCGLDALAIGSFLLRKAGPKPESP